MWVLAFVAILNGQVYLDVRPQADKASCHAKAVEMLEKANEAKIPFAASCKEIKLV